MRHFGHSSQTVSRSVSGLRRVRVHTFIQGAAGCLRRVMRRSTQYDTIVLSGGGVKGIASLGATQLLLNKGYLKDVTTFIGTSAGAIVATALAMKIPPKSIFVDHVLPFAWKHDIDINLLDKGFGVDTGATLDKWLRTIVPESLTFRRVQQEYGSTLIIVATNLNTRAPEYFGPSTTPDLTIVKALRMSCSVPLYFAAITHEGMLYVDGGCTDNFPVEYAVHDLGSSSVLGIRFVSQPKPKHHQWSLDTFLGAVLESTLLQRLPKHVTVIDLECGSTTMPLHFKLPLETKEMLYREGYAQAALYMKKRV